MKNLENITQVTNSLEQKGLAIAESLQRVLSSIEAISDVVKNFFTTIQKQRENVVEFGHQAGENLKPLTNVGVKIFDSSRKTGELLVRRSRANPTPFVVGGIAVLGGIAILAYYLNKEEAARNHKTRAVA